MMKRQATYAAIARNLRRLLSLAEQSQPEIFFIPPQIADDDSRRYEMASLDM